MKVMVQPEDRRVHSRLQTQLAIDITVDGETRPAELKDLSQGGACILVFGDELARAQRLDLVLPTATGVIDVGASVVRSTPVRGGAVTAVRFRNTESSQLTAIDGLLGELLVAAGGGGREHPRISRRLQVPIESKEDMIAVIENISLGGLAMKVDAPLEVGEKLLVVLPSDGGDDMLSLRACVANQRPHDEDSTPNWVVGLTFNELSKQHHVLLDALLVNLLSDA